MKIMSWVGRVVLLGVLVVLCGCPPTGGTPSGKQTPISTEEEHPAIKEAKSKDDGSSLAAGEKREVTTSNGIVIVAKDAAGKVTYTRK